jgi:hypothetical protein
MAEGVRSPKTLQTPIRWNFTCFESSRDLRPLSRPRICYSPPSPHSHVRSAVTTALVLASYCAAEALPPDRMWAMLIIMQFVVMWCNPNPLPPPVSGIVSSTTRGKGCNPFACPLPIHKLNACPILFTLFLEQCSSNAVLHLFGVGQDWDDGLGCVRTCSSVDGHHHGYLYHERQDLRYSSRPRIFS